MTRPTIILKKTHNESFGCHAAQSTLTSIYGCSNDSGEALVHEKLNWAIFDIQALTFTSRFVLIAAGESVWSKGWDAVRDGLKGLVHEFSIHLGVPSLMCDIGDDVPQNTSSWFLQTPDNQYHTVVFDPKLGVVHLTPVFAMRPDDAPGSIEALRLIFPKNADQGVEALSTLFADPSLPSGRGDT